MNSFACSEAFVTLATQKLDKIVAFYTVLFESTPKVYKPNTYAEFLTPGLKLGIFQPCLNNFVEFAASSSGAMSLCLEVEDLDAAIAHLIASGYPPSGVPVTASHGREIYAYDPDGNRLILHQGITPIADDM
ncbi:MAG: hypothetical protein F6K42_07900 [Leptolyngbya sp. SIO1D8]|nr:hypothetical protein [Leptolyngbya sp. SIO1D8]